MGTQWGGEEWSRLWGRATWELTLIHLNIHQLVQEVLHAGNALQQEGVQGCHPQLLALAQLLAQVADALHSLHKGQGARAESHGPEGDPEWGQTPATQISAGEGGSAPHRCGGSSALLFWNLHPGLSFCPLSSLDQPKASKSCPECSGAQENLKVSSVCQR